MGEEQGPRPAKRAKVTQAFNPAIIAFGKGNGKGQWVQMAAPQMQQMQKRGKGTGKGKKREDPSGSGRVHVRGFDFNTTGDQLVSHMAAAGDVVDVHWITKGSAIVVFKKAAMAKEAV